MTSLALTVCAHIAATLYPPQFWPLIIGFCPFKPDAQPSICPTLYLAGGGGDGKGDGVASGVMPFVSLAAEVLGRGMGMAPAGVPIASLVVEGMRRGMGMASGVMP